jgi:hypothetical protein
VARLLRKRDVEVKLLLIHHQLATTLGIDDKVVGDLVAEMPAGRASDTTHKGGSLNLGLGWIPIFSGLSDTLPVREWLHVVKSTLTASGVPTASWVTRAMLRLLGDCII